MAIINVDDAYILNETGAQVDKTTGIPFKDESRTEAEAAQARASIRAGGTNPNLLDNPWFTVNQRSLSTYALPAFAYCVDRWKSSGGNTITVSTNGISITAGAGTHQNLAQGCPIIGDLLGRTVTASVMSQTGAISSVTFTLPPSIGSGSLYDGGSVTVDGVGLKVYIANSYSGLPSGYTFWLYSSGTAQTVTYRAVKLELGTVSTLANDTPPDYGTELLKCRYYFRRIQAAAAGGLALAYASSATRADFIDYTQGVPMRPTTTPTATFNGTLNLYNGTNHAVSAIYAIANGTQYNLRLDTTGLTANQALIVSAGGAAYIDISHDL